MKKLRPIIVQSNAAFVFLTKGQIAIIDREDVEKVIGYNWTAISGIGDSFYARRGTHAGKIFPMHKVITGKFNNTIDHINRNSLDNRKENLRVCSLRQNSANRKSAKNSSSKFLGVHWNRQSQKWQVTIRKDGKYYHLGLFKDERIAALAYNIAAYSKHGEFANLNNLSNT